jgi:O-methyltransferase
MKDSFADHQLRSAKPQHTFQGYPIISDQISKEGLQVVWRELEKVLQQAVAGHVVEFGCYAGTTSLFIRRLLNKYPHINREFHVYDSFQGLPEKTTQDSNAAGVDFEAGKLFVTKNEFIKVFKSANVLLPYIHKGWFNELSPASVPKPIAFAFLDGDFYSSIIDSLRLVWPVLSEQGVIVVDDYKRETLPGVAQALRDFFRDKPAVIRAEHNKAIITRQKQ